MESQYGESMASSVSQCEFGAVSELVESVSFVSKRCLSIITIYLVNKYWHSAALAVSFDTFL
jgi:hypothetical protein